MVRVFSFVALIFTVALGLVWLAERPGEVTVNWLGYDIRASVPVAAGAMLAAFAALALVWSILRAILRSPRAVRGYLADRRRDRGYRALSDGMLAIGAGDGKKARREAQTAARLLEGEPLTLLLTAQAAQLRRDLPAARDAFETMLLAPKTRLLGLHGLFVEAQRQKEHEAAQHYAEEAHRLEPAVGWAALAVFDYQAASGDWHGAMRTLAAW